MLHCVTTYFKRNIIFHRKRDEMKETNHTRGTTSPVVFDRDTYDSVGFCHCFRRRREEAGQVRVVIYNATGSGRAEARDVGLLYSVSVAGQPVPAISAAADMRLLTLSEVSAELGYPVLTKAERKQSPGSFPTNLENSTINRDR